MDATPVVRIVGLDRLPDCLAIRRTVFIEGQDVPEDLEVDGLDGECVHALATLDGRPVGTARLRRAGGVAKAERVAVLDEVRGLGVGRLLMLAIEEEARRLGLPEMKLNAQTAVVGFYDKLDYEAYGPGFMEAGIPHQAMKKRL